MSNQHVGDDSFYIKHIATLCVFSCLAISAVVLRFWSRRIQRLALEWSDFLILPGLVCALGEACFAIYVCFFGRRRDESSDQSPQAQETAVILASKAIFIDPIIWVIAVTCIRSSILSLYLKLFRKRFLQVASYYVLGCNVVFAVTTILTDCLLCRPVAYRWNRSIKGQCGTQRSFDLYVGIVNLLLDVTIVALPMPVLWHLQMPLRRKVVLSGMFGLGIAICALTLYRLYATVSIDPNNWQEGYSIVILFTCLEALLGVINACLPVLGPIISKFRAASLGRSGGVDDMNSPAPIRIRLDRNYSPKEYATIGDELSPVVKSALEGAGSSEVGVDEFQSVGGRSCESIFPDQVVQMSSGSRAPGIHVRTDVDVEILRNGAPSEHTGGEYHTEKW